jgi:hypothetical protein
VSAAKAFRLSRLTKQGLAEASAHFVVLRHQEGDDWDYVVIQHLGSKAEVTATAPPPSDAVRALSAWHSDTFVSGPSWAEFSKEMSISGSTNGLVYLVGVHRAVPGHREQLFKSLSAAGPSAKIQTGSVVLQHLEGSEWTFATITRYNSWQDVATERAFRVSSRHAHRSHPSRQVAAARAVSLRYRSQPGVSSTVRHPAT